MRKKSRSGRLILYGGKVEDYNILSPILFLRTIFEEYRKYHVLPFNGVYEISFYKEILKENPQAQGLIWTVTKEGRKVLLLVMKE